MANTIQRSLSDRGRRALRRYTPGVCEQAHRAFDGEGYNLYETGMLLGFTSRQARSAIDAWQEVQVVARALGVEPAIVVDEAVRGVQGCVGICLESCRTGNLCKAGECKRRPA